MSTHKHIDKICCVILAITLIITVLFINSEQFGIAKAEIIFEYESLLFDTSKVHTIDIVMNNWDDFISTCTNEEYSACSVIIDNQAYKNVAIRAKGNTSLSSVQSYGNDRYSFKIEFDHYDDTTTYYGLDKLSLNNIIQDNTYMKDYLCYQMMREAGADAPLCSYVQVLVNGEEWGLYLAVEGVEESFLQRNYGSDYGELYKPDSMSMGGGIGNGGKFNMDDWQKENYNNSTDQNSDNGSQMQGRPNMDNFDFSQFGDFKNGEIPDISQFGNGEMPNIEKGEKPESMPDMGGFSSGVGKGFGVGSNDVSLIYSDDDYDSYSNIFDNAKTDITNSDKDRLISSIKQLNANENIEDVVDVEAVIRYFVAHNFTVNFDSYTGSMIHNYYLYEKDGKLTMLPWDYNLAFGGFHGGNDSTSTVNYPIDSPVSGGTIESRPMLAWIFESEEYTELYHQYFEEFIENYFTSGRFEEEINYIKEMISPYVESDPTKFCTYMEFEQGIDTLKEFCLLRADSIKGQLDGTIPSTSDAQNEDNSALIDASHISVSDMGSMGKGNMGSGMKPNNSDSSQSDSEKNNQSSSSENQIPQIPNMENIPQRPDGQNGSSPPEIPSNFNNDNQGAFPQMPNDQLSPDIPSSGFEGGFGQFQGEQGSI